MYSFTAFLALSKSNIYKTKLIDKDILQRKLHGFCELSQDEVEIWGNKMRIENDSEILIYQTEDGRTKIDLRMENETVWLSLNQMADLFQRDKSVISKHIKNVFDEGELSENNPTVAKIATVQNEGGRDIKRDIEFYSLILS